MLHYQPWVGKMFNQCMKYIINDYPNAVYAQLDYLKYLRASMTTDEGYRKTGYRLCHHTALSTMGW